jgi:hypothetical protein
MSRQKCVARREKTCVSSSASSQQMTLLKFTARLVSEGEQSAANATESFQGGGVSVPGSTSMVATWFSVSGSAAPGARTGATVSWRLEMLSLGIEAGGCIVAYPWRPGQVGPIAFIR